MARGCDRALARVGVIGDVHAESDTLANALSFLHTQNVELLLCTGDVVDGKGDVAESVRLLHDHQVVTVRGNHDRWFQGGENREVENATDVDVVDFSVHEFLESLAAVEEYDTVAGRLMLCHGLGEFDMACVRTSDSEEEIYNNLELWALYRRGDLRFIINGHTHRRLMRSFDHLTVINAGTLHRDFHPCCLIADFNGQFVQYFDIDRQVEFTESNRLGFA